MLSSMSGQNRGFTIIELLITMVIVVILLTLGTVAVRSSLIKARDSERASDVEAIAMALERRYSNGNTLFNPTASYTSWMEAGTYPNVKEVSYGLGNTRAEFNPTTAPASGTAYLTQAYNLTQAAITTPAGLTLDTECISCTQPAEDQTQLDNAFKVSGSWVDKYIYEPIDASGAVCTTGPCVRFNLYWRSEETGSISKVRSKHQ